MNYRHAFHAGNFADVMKHVVLLAVLAELARKPAPCAVFDLHAGRGGYDLGAAEALRTREHEQGIGRLWGRGASAPAVTAGYLELVRAYQERRPGDAAPRYYPGSPWLLRQRLRAQDRLVLCERVADEYAALAASCRGDRRVAVHERDAWEALGALLPPREKRGMVVLDPPYEPPAAEFARIFQALPQVRRRFAAGVVVLWYPIKDRTSNTRMLRRMAALDLGEILVAELCVWPDDTTLRLNGSGMLIVNPPWQLEAVLAPELAWLWRQLAHDGHGRHDVRLL